MVEKIAVEYLTHKLRSCDTLTDLARVWIGIGIDYKRTPEVLRTKDERKAELGG
mgnify:CR=1 FL=1|tara:strand:- start:24766 stop:24927 length:162 start_codon:yes stop_codon:yes gene_type:complete